MWLMAAAREAVGADPQVAEWFFWYITRGKRIAGPATSRRAAARAKAFWWMTYKTPSV